VCDSVGWDVNTRHPAPQIDTKKTCGP